MLWSLNQMKIQDKCSGFITATSLALTERSIPCQPLKQISPEKVAALGTDIKHPSQVSSITLRNKSKPSAIILKTLKKNVKAKYKGNILYVGWKEGKACLRREASYLRPGNHLEDPLECLSRTMEPKKNKSNWGV